MILLSDPEDERVRDPLRTEVVRAELDRLQKRREEATKRPKRLLPQSQNWVKEFIPERQYLPP
jgi:hypothetical protein